MPFLLRTVRKARWYQHPHKEYPWLVAGELQADALLDFVTEHNSLSVWVIDDNRENLLRVIAALAANRDKPSNLDFALIDERTVSDFVISVEETPGDTADDEVNKWHLDLVKLTVSKLVKLVNATKTPERVPAKNVSRLIIDSVTSSHIDTAKVRNPDLLKRLGL